MLHARYLLAALLSVQLHTISPRPTDDQLEIHANDWRIRIKKEDRKREASNSMSRSSGSTYTGHTRCKVCFKYG